MSASRKSIELWQALYPKLLDREAVIHAYEMGGTQEGAAALIGCCEKTYRKALKYHGIAVVGKTLLVKK